MVKKIISIVWGLLLVFAMQSQIVKLSPLDFYKKMSETSSKNIVDVRTEEEYKKGHIATADNIDWNGVEFEEFFTRFDKKTPVFIYCLSGGRSHNAAQKAQALGYQKIYELDGGMMAWRAEGLPEITSIGYPKNQMKNADYVKLYLDKKHPVLIDFYAEWCMPCRKMKPYLDNIQKELGDKIEIVRIDADQHPLLLKEIQVEGLPTLILYENNTEKWRRMGLVSEQEMRKAIQN